MNANHEMEGSRTMKHATAILGFATVIACCAAVSAQTPAPAANSTINEAAPTTYRLTYTVTELDGAKRIGTQHFSLTVNPASGDSQLKLGNRVPIAVGVLNPGRTSAQENAEIQYMDVGLNIAAHVREFQTGVEVYSKLEQASVAEEESGVNKTDPVIRQAVLQNTALLTIGKPVMLGSLDIPGSTRHLDIEVALEVVR